MIWKICSGSLEKYVQKAWNVLQSYKLTFTEDFTGDWFTTSQQHFAWQFIIFFK